MTFDPLHKPDPKPPGQNGARIAKLLARAGVASRRDIEAMIAQGRVALGGQIVTSPALNLPNLQGVTVDGEDVKEAEATRVFRFFKPPGCVTSNADAHGRPTVFDLLPKGLPRLVTVGRLDYNTEGLLLLTNDGGLARHLELPANAYVRRYRVRVFGAVTQRQLDKLKSGITIEDVRYGPIDARLEAAKSARKAGAANQWLTITLQEGKNREVRRICAHLGLRVTRLIRLSFGVIGTDGLQPGEVDELSLADILRLRRVPVPEKLPEETGRKPKEREKPDKPRAERPASQRPAAARTEKSERDAAHKDARRTFQGTSFETRGRSTPDRPRKPFKRAEDKREKETGEGRLFKRRHQEGARKSFMRKKEDAPGRPFTHAPKRNGKHKPVRTRDGATGDTRGQRGPARPRKSGRPASGARPGRSPRKPK